MKTALQTLAIIGFALFPAQAIVGGKDAIVGEFPYIASLARTSNFCDGIVVSSRYILTAASCVQAISAGSLIVRVGSLRHASGGIIFRVDAITLSPPDIQLGVSLSGASASVSDLALLHLTTNITLDGTTITAATLPVQGQDPTPGTTLALSGWGPSSKNSGSQPATLKRVSVGVLARTTCQQRETGSAVVVDDKKFCGLVNGGGKGACGTDTGGPVTAGATVVGVISSAEGCGAAGVPDVYVRIGEYTDWIHRVIGA